MPPPLPSLPVAFGQWLFASLVLAMAALLLWRRMRIGARSLDALLFGLIWACLAEAFVMGLGLAGWLNARRAFWICLAGGAGMLAARRAEFKEAAFEGISAARRAIAWAVAPGRRAPAALLALLFAAQLLRFAAHIWYLPPYVADAISYHLPNVAHWIQEERLAVLETPVLRAYWPANFALMQAWFALFPHHDWMIEAAGIPFYALAVGATYSIGRSLGLRRRSAAFAAAFFAYTPALALHATGCTNDIAIAALFLMILAFILEGRPALGWRDPRVAAIALALAMAIGTKPTIVFISPGLAAAAVWRWRGASRRGGNPSRVGWAPLCFVALLAAPLALYWYIRNAAIFGNPFYPTPLAVLGRTIFEGAPEPLQQGFFSISALGENLALFFREKLLDLGDAYNVDLNDMTGWGWFAFACGWPFVFWGVFARRELRALSGVFLLAFASLLCWVSPDPWNMRFTLWVPALHAVAFAAGAASFRSPRLRAAFGGLAGGALLLNFVGTLDVGRLDPMDWDVLAATPLRHRSTANLGLYIGSAHRDALRAIPPEEPLGYCAGVRGKMYALYGPSFSRRPVNIILRRGANVRAVMEACGTRYLFVSYPGEESHECIRQALWRHDLRPLGTGLYALTE